MKLYVWHCFYVIFLIIFPILERVTCKGPPFMWMRSISSDLLGNVFRRIGKTAGSRGGGRTNKKNVDVQNPSDISADGGSSTGKEVLDVRDRVVFVSGALGGIGKELCLKLQSQGARLIMFSRPFKKRHLDEFCSEELTRPASGSHETEAMDFTRLDDITKYARRLRRSYEACFSAAAPREAHSDSDASGAAADSAGGAKTDSSSGSGDVEAAGSDSSSEASSGCTSGGCTAHPPPAIGGGGGGGCSQGGRSCSGADVLIHNAGLMDPAASVRDTHLINCIAPFALTLAQLPFMVASGTPRSAVVFVASSSHLRAAKYSVGDLARCLADEQQLHSAAATATAAAASTAATRRSRGPLGWHLAAKQWLHQLQHKKKVLRAYAQSKYNLMLLGMALESLVTPPPATYTTTHYGTSSDRSSSSIESSGQSEVLLGSEQQQQREGEGEEPWHCGVFHTHPGIVDTPMLQNVFGTGWSLLRRRVLLTPAEGAENVLSFQGISAGAVAAYRQSSSHAAQRRISPATRWLYPERQQQRHLREQQSQHQQQHQQHQRGQQQEVRKRRLKVDWSAGCPPVYAVKGRISPQFTHSTLFPHNNPHLVLQMRCCLQEALACLPAGLIDEMLQNINTVQQSKVVAASDSRTAVLQQLKMVLQAAQ